jgi:hypothetical protein
MNDREKPQIPNVSLCGQRRRADSAVTKKPAMIRKLTFLALCLLFFVSGIANAASETVPLVDRLAVSQGSVKFNLVKGMVSAKFNLAPLPAIVDTGTEQFTATIYKAYLISSTDPAIEIPLATLYPTTLGKAVVKTLLKGNVSLLGLDRFVVVAYSKDGLFSFDVLTGTLTLP